VPAAAPAAEADAAKRPLVARAKRGARAPSGARADTHAALRLYAIVGSALVALAAIVVVAVVVTRAPESPRPEVANVPAPATPPPTEATAETPPPPAPVTPAPPPDAVEPLSPLRRAERAIAEAKRLVAAKEPGKARTVLEAALADKEIYAHPVGSDLITRELRVVAQAEADAKQPTPAPDDKTEKPDASPDEPAKPERARPRVDRESQPSSTGEALRAIRAKEASLDLADASALLDSLDGAMAKTEKEEIDARGVFLDALGAAVSPGATIALAEGGKRQKIAKCSAKGIALDWEGSPDPIAWSRFPRGAVLELVNAAEKSVVAPPMAAALVLYDLGFWQRGDQKVKAWLDADAVARPRAFGLVARSRGLDLVPPDGYSWHGEWLSVAEDQARQQDLVTVDAHPITREEAKKLVDKQRKDRRPNQKAKDKEQRARADRLLKDYGVTDVRTILYSGDPAKRCDIVVIADGFAEADVPKFEHIAAGLAKTVLTIEPFRNYSRYVNVHRVTVVESKSGIGGTRLGSMVENGVLSCSSEKAVTYAALAPDADLVVVVANINNVRASAVRGVISLDASPDFSEVALHELGHAFGDLADEYVDAVTAREFPDFDEEGEHLRKHLNVTRESNPLKSKWHYWNLPPLLPEADRIVCAPGAYYRTNYFRPAKQCRMGDRSCHHYCPVCLEQMEKSLYERLEPIDDATPRVPEVALWRDETVKFEATAIAIEAAAGENLGGFSALWWVDGHPVTPRSAGIKTAYELRTGSLSAGDHSVAVRVDLNDTRVRRDDGLLSSSRGWRVHVFDALKPKIVAPEIVQERRGDVISFDVSLEGGPDDFRLAAKGVPGASFMVSGRAGRWLWAPPRDARGAFRVIFSAGEGATRVERATDVVIQDEAHNVDPVFRDPGVVNATRGTPVEVALEATDPDGDSLVYTPVKKLPPGAELDAATGVFRWTPNYSSPYETDLDVAVRVSDGKLQDEITLKIHVDNHPIEKAGPGFDILVATRSPNAEVRRGALAELAKSDLTMDGKILELTRLMRDYEPDIAGTASKILHDLPGSDDSTKAMDLRRNLIALDMGPRVWQLTDRPYALGFLRDLTLKPLEAEAKAVGAKLQKELIAVEKYNRDRGVR
jgi:hypothetical protein